MKKLALALLLVPLGLGCARERIKEASTGLARKTVSAAKAVAAEFRGEPVQYKLERKAQYASQQNAAIQQTVASYADTYETGELTMRSSGLSWPPS